MKIHSTLTFVLFLVILAGCQNAGAAVAQSRCTDSDGGIDPNVAGTVLYSGARYADTCGPGVQQLTEYYCSGSRPAKQAITCTTPCVNGMCVPPPPPPAGSTASVRATSCDGDAVCEMNSAQVTQTLTSGEILTNMVSTPNRNLIVSSDNQGNIRFGATGQVDMGAVFTPSAMIPALTITSTNTPTGQQNSEVNLFTRLVMKALSQPQLEIDSTDANQPAAIRFRTGASVAHISSLNGKIGIGTPNPQAELDVLGKVKADYMQTGVMYADAFKMGQSPNCNPALVYQSAQFGGLQPCGTIEVNSPLSVQEITAPQFLNEIKIHKTIEVYGEVGVQHDVEAGGVRVRSLAGQGRSFACFDDTGRLVRSDTPCR